MNNKLLCTFIDKQNLHNVLYKIKKKYSFPVKVFVLVDINNPDSMYCVYNIDADVLDTYGVLQRTIIVNRKKETNSIYTINALNKIVANMNGSVDTKFNIQ